MHKVKSLWKGVFVLNRETFILYAHAYTLRQAWLIMCRQIAKRQSVIPSMVTNYFNGEKDNFKITLEIEWKEVAGNEL
jgi:hypothetical protein